MNWEQKSIETLSVKEMPRTREMYTGNKSDYAPAHIVPGDTHGSLQFPSFFLVRVVVYVWLCSAVNKRGRINRKED